MCFPMGWYMSGLKGPVMEAHALILADQLSLAIFLTPLCVFWPISAEWASLFWSGRRRIFPTQGNHIQFHKKAELLGYSGKNLCNWHSLLHPVAPGGFCIVVAKLGMEVVGWDSIYVDRRVLSRKTNCQPCPEQTQEQLPPYALPSAVCSSFPWAGLAFCGITLGQGMSSPGV